MALLVSLAITYTSKFQCLHSIPIYYYYHYQMQLSTSVPHSRSGSLASSMWWLCYLLGHQSSVLNSVHPGSSWEEREHEGFHRRFREPGPKMAHIMCPHIPLARAQSCTLPNCRGSWKVLSGCVTGRKRKWHLARTQQYLCHITSSGVPFQKSVLKMSWVITV